jgi:hypothetical protein
MPCFCVVQLDHHSSVTISDLYRDSQFCSHGGVCRRYRLQPAPPRVWYHEAMHNNEPLIQLIADEKTPGLPTPRAKTRSSPCLPERLPNLAFLQREAEYNAPLAIIRQLRRRPSFPGTEEQPEYASESADGDSATLKPNKIQPAGERSTQKPRVQQAPGGWKPPQQFEIFRAIERKDVMFL